MSLLPVIFIGHGSPMNALADNNYTKALENLGKSFSKPKAIVCISAHWVTAGHFVTNNKSPKTIHDFYGFPQELFNVQYPAPGAPDLATTISKKISSVKESSDWGFDHGMWSVLKHLYKDANIPSLQISLDHQFNPKDHFQLGQELKFLRDEGILIIGSGNIVHNLRSFSMKSGAEPFPWATEFDEIVKSSLQEKNSTAILSLPTESPSLFSKSHPSPEHFAPLWVILGASDSHDKPTWIYEGIEHSSISMQSVIWSPA